MEEGGGQLQFFVRKVSRGQSIVIHGRSGDTVEYVHKKLAELTGIPMEEQRLIYNGRQLQLSQSLADCSIQKDAMLQLVCRMRSTRCPRAWQVSSEIAAYVSRLCSADAYYSQAQYFISNLIKEFFKLIPEDGTDCLELVRVFIACSCPAALVRLYASVHDSMKECADICIRCFLSSSKSHKNSRCNIFCLPVILEFCMLLKQVVSEEDLLYRHCRNFLATAFGSVKFDCAAGWSDVKYSLNVAEFFVFFKEVGDELFHKLELMTTSSLLESMEDIIEEFSSFVNALMCIIYAEVGHNMSTELSTLMAISETTSIAEEIKKLRLTYTALLEKMNRCLGHLEECLHGKATDESETDWSMWSHHLILLKELYRISFFYDDAGNEFWTIMKSRKAVVCALIIRHANRDNDYQWLMQHKEVTDFHSRWHLALMMFPEMKHDFDEPHEMLIDRSNLLSDSLEYITSAASKTLHNGLVVEFKNEEATGPGVLREWFYSVIQAIFDERNALFVACPNDRRRFYPTPATKVDLMQLKYYTFTGRVMALAIMHKIQMGLVFDRVFTLQLSGMPITLEDIRDADPLLYSSCKQILAMDSDYVDSDGLGLTFETEFDDLGVIKSVELCSDGKNKIVNSENREEFINLLIYHRFVKSISEQLAHFAKGFTDILSTSVFHTVFFQSLDHEDLDRILHGTRSDVSIDDWQKHTDYKGFTAADPQIYCFWQIVKSMSPEQKKSLLFFWTSIKHLPFDGFCGLPSRLQITYCAEPSRRLPSSHTCFYELCLPSYSSQPLMRHALDYITQEHVSCSFGTF